MLLLEGEPVALERVVRAAALELAVGDRAERTAVADDRGAMEAVVTAESPARRPLAGELDVRKRYDINVLAISRSGERITNRLRSVRFRPGDVVVVQGARHAARRAERAGLPAARRA